MNKWKLIAFIAFFVILTVVPAYATVMETSLAVRDRLPASTIADMPSFIARMETVGSAVSYGPQGYYAVYNADDLKGIFGDDALLVPNGGLIMISYMRGGTYRYFGAMHGLIVADSASKAITITKGGFISPEDVGVNIAGDEIVIDARNPAKASFKISKNGVYSEKTRFFGCLPENEASNAGCVDWQYPLELFPEQPAECSPEEMGDYREHILFENRCRLTAVITPSSAYLNITGAGFMFNSRFLEDYSKEGYEAMIELYLDTEPEEPPLGIYIADMSEITFLEGGTRLEITALPFPAGTIYSYETGEIKIKSGDKVDISFYRDNLLQVSGNNAKIITNTDVGIRVKESGIGSMQLFLRAFPSFEFPIKIAEIKNGKAFFIRDRDRYSKCKRSNIPYVSASCMLLEYNDNIEGYKMTVKPKQAIEQRGSAPFLDMEIIASTGLPLLYVEIEPFERQDSLSKVRIANAETGTKIFFDNINIGVEPTGRDWADLGVSFKGNVYPLQVEGELLNIYDTIECKLPERKCYLNGAEVIGFERGYIQKTATCNADSECRHNQVCLENLCVMKATCEELELGDRTGGSNKADILFVGDRYSSQGDFADDVRKIIDERGIYHGLFSTEPFNENNNIQRFRFKTAYGSAAPLLGTVASLEEAEGNMRYILSYVNEFKKQCPSADYTIFVSKNPIFGFTVRDNRINIPLIGKIGGASMEGAYIGTDEPDFPALALHEFGHLFGGLKDEYVISYGDSGGDYGSPNCLIFEVANRDEEWGYDLASKAKAEGWYGCGGICGIEDCTKYYLRPSENSIMRDEDLPGGLVFNEPSIRQLRGKISTYN